MLDGGRATAGPPRRRGSYQRRSRIRRRDSGYPPRVTAPRAEPESSPTVVSSARAPSSRLRSHWVIILAGFVIHVAATFFWLRAGGFFDRPPTQDAAWSRLEAFVILQGAKDGLPGILAAAYRFAPAYHPPLNPLVLALVAYVTGMPLEGATIFIPTFLYGFVFLCASGMLIGHLLRPEHRRLAALVVVCAPGFIVFLRPGFAQLPMVSLSLLTAAFLLTSDWLERWPRVVLASLTAALAIFTKNLGPMEVGGFCLAYLAVTIAQRRMSAGRLLARVVVFLLPIVALDLPWYLSHLHEILKYKEEVTGSQGQVIWSGGIPLASVQRWVALPWYFCRYCVGTPAAVVALVLVAAGLAGFVRRKTDRPLTSLWADSKGLLCLLAGVAISYVVMTFGQVHADAHFIMHWIPVYAIVLSPLAHLPAPRAGAILRAMLVVVSAVLAALCYVPFQKGDVLLGVAGVPIVDHQDARMFGKAAREAGARPRPDPERWPVDRLVEESSRWKKGAHALIGVLSLDDLPSPYFLRVNIVFEAMRRGLDVDLKELEIKDRPMADAVAQIASCDVLLIDSNLGSASDIDLVLRSQGFGLELLSDYRVTDRYRFLVYGLKRVK